MLINPAVDSAVYEPIHALTRRTKFDEFQTPLMLVISSEGDSPNRIWFPWGRMFSVRHEPDGSRAQFEQKLDALGWHRPHVTHCLSLACSATCYQGHQAPKPPKIEVANECSCEDAERIRFDEQAARRNIAQWTAAGFDGEGLARLPLAGDHPDVGGLHFQRLDRNLDPNNPFVIVKATTDVSRDHNDMFNPHLVNFVLRYAAGAQLKRMTVRKLEAAR